MMKTTLEYRFLIIPGTKLFLGMWHVFILLSCLVVSDAFLYASPLTMMYSPFAGAARFVRTVRITRQLLRIVKVIRR
ncbi:hypothetical protein NPIL_669191, partial [Nephila pilipes]